MTLRDLLTVCPYVTRFRIKTYHTEGLGDLYLRYQLLDETGLVTSEKPELLDREIRQICNDTRMTRPTILVFLKKEGAAHDQ